MTQNQIKSRGISILSVLLIGYVLIRDFSLIKLACAALAIGAVLLIALVYRKEQSIVEKIELYILIAYLWVLAIHYEQLQQCFSKVLLTHGINSNMNLRVTSLIAGLVLGGIFNSISKTRTSLAAKIINKYTDLLCIISGFSIFFFAKVDFNGLAQDLFIFSVFGIIAFCRSNRTSDARAINRLFRISFLLAAISLILLALFPTFRLYKLNANAFLSTIVFPWYSVLGITFVLTSIVGMGFHFGRNVVDEDSIFLMGIVGLIFVIKASVFFWFDFNWIAICIYVIFFFSFTNRFIKKNKAGKRLMLSNSLKDNEMYWILISAASIVCSILLINTGYIFFWISLILGLFIVLFLNKNVVGWVKDAVFWDSILFSISGTACMISLQNGYSMKKITIIAVFFVFASIIMWMLNHKNYIGQNKFKMTKIVMIVAFAILVIIPAMKAGVHINVAFEKNSANIGALVIEQTGLKITATPDGKDNAIRKLSYVWCDSFRYDKDAVVKSDKTKILLKIENNHLIIWAEDRYGVVTRKDCWFYDAARSDYNSKDIYRIRLNKK